MTAATPSARERLLGRVVDHLLGSGSVTLSLRALAQEVGSSHRMLRYHFGGQAGLVRAVVEEVEARQQAALATMGQDGDRSIAELSWAFWVRLSSPELAPVERLFFQLYARLLDTGDTETAARMAAVWSEQVSTLMVARGIDQHRARALTRLGMATYRGLLLDLLATGDRPGADEAARAYIEAVFGENPAGSA